MIREFDMKIKCVVLAGGTVSVVHAVAGIGLGENTP